MSNSKTRHYLFAVIFTLFCLLSPGLTYADPPQDVTLTYNSETQSLTVTVTHKTTFAGFHYVKQLEIRKNGEAVKTSNFKSQPDKPAFTQTYAIPAIPGDKFEVNAICNLQGNKTATLLVSETQN